MDIQVLLPCVHERTYPVTLQAQGWADACLGAPGPRGRRHRDAGRPGGGQGQVSALDLK